MTQDKLSKQLKEIERTIAQAEAVMSTEQTRISGYQDRIKAIEDELQSQIEIARERVAGLQAGIKEAVAKVRQANEVKLTQGGVLAFVKGALEEAKEDAGTETAEVVG